MFQDFRSCVEAYRIYSGIMSHFLYLKISSKIDCVVYTGMYNFMKVIHVYTSLQCFIIDMGWRVCECYAISSQASRVSCLNYNTHDVLSSRTHRTFQCLVSS